MSIYNNLWWKVHDFTPCGDASNWSLLGECYKTSDFWSEDKLEHGLSFDKSVVPLTIGNRVRDVNNSVLMMIFNDDLQNERAVKIIEYMMNNKADQIELIKSRKMNLDPSDAERLFGSQDIRQNAIRGQIIALQVPFLIHFIITDSKTIFFSVQRT